MAASRSTTDGAQGQELPEPDFLSFVERPFSAPPDSWEDTKSRAFLSWSYRDCPWRAHEKFDGPTDVSGFTSTEPRSARISRRSHGSQGSCQAPAGAEQVRPALPPRPYSTCGSHGTGGKPRRQKCWTSRCNTPAVGSRASPDDALACLDATLRPGSSQQMAMMPSRAESVAATEQLCSEASLEMSGRSMRRRMEDCSCSMETSRELGAAAEALGERARGPVTMALRAKAICRLAASSASRQVLHCVSDGDRLAPSASEQAPTRMLDDGPEEDQVLSREAWGDLERSLSSSSRQRRRSLPEQRELDFPGEVRNPPPDYLRGGRHREIRIPQNTTLGQMVKRDPDRAAKYDLVTVPPWHRNRPWPPPQAKPSRRVPSRRMASSERNEVGPKSPSRWGQIKAVSKMVGLASSSSKRQTLRQPTEVFQSKSFHTTHAAKEESDFQVDFLTARMLFAPEEEEHLRLIFSRFGAGNRLSRQGLQRAMREAGIMASNFSEQGKFKEVQSKVLEHSRGTDGLEDESNPLTHKKGFWHVEEFLLMAAGMKQLEIREHWKANEALATELGLSPEALEEFRAVFEEVDEDKSGSIGIQELQRLLVLANLHSTDRELKVLLRRLGFADELTFTQFLTTMVKVEEFVRPNKSD